MKALGFHSAASVHVMVEAMRHVYMGRNSYLGDSSLFSNLFNRLLSKDYAAQIRTRIMPGRATPSVDVQPGRPSHKKT